MTDSTKLELDAHYYLKLKNGNTEVQKFIGGFVLRNDDEIAEVLGKVPSYEEFQNLKEYEQTILSYNMKPIDYEIACETVYKLLDDNKRLKHDIGNLGYKIKNQRHEIDNRLKEIEKLKSLLKELKRYFDADGRYYIKKRILLEINQVLGEE